MIATNPGSTKSQPREEPALRPVEEPSEVCGELLRFRPRKQGAEAEGVQETSVVEPLSPLDEFSMHYRDLSGRSPE